MKFCSFVSRGGLNLKQNLNSWLSVCYCHIDKAQSNSDNHTIHPKYKINKNKKIIENEKKKGN